MVPIFKKEKAGQAITSLCSASVQMRCVCQDRWLSKSSPFLSPGCIYIWTSCTAGATQMPMPAPGQPGSGSNLRKCECCGLNTLFPESELCIFTTAWWHWRRKQNRLCFESRTPSWAGLWTLSYIPSIYGNYTPTGKPARKEEPQGSPLPKRIP